MFNYSLANDAEDSKNENNNPAIVSSNLLKNSIGVNFYSKLEANSIIRFIKSSFDKFYMIFKKF